MYIKNIHLHRVKCLKGEPIAFDRPKQSMMLAGNNGAGKSAILRAIAMGLCDRDSAASLLRELSGNFVKFKEDKDQENDAEIIIKLYDSSAENGAEEFIISTKITEYPEIIGETVEQTITVPHMDNRKISIPNQLSEIMELCRDQTGRIASGSVSKYIPWDNIFATGYGPGLRTSGTAKFAQYFAPDALYSIFNYASSLQDPEIAWRRLVDTARRAVDDKWSSVDTEDAVAAFDEGEVLTAEETDDYISRLIHQILELAPHEKVVLKPNGIFIQNTNKENQFIDLDARGDGHKALTKVILDILIWWLLFKNYEEDVPENVRCWEPIEFSVKNGSLCIEEIEGIVIIDEIEQHLHPKLQRTIVRNLDRIFPNVQFIISTHSPLCLSGVADVDHTQNGGYKIYSIFKEGDRSKIKEMPIPYGLRADQILVDYFELSTSLNITTEKMLHELDELYAQAPRDETRISAILSELSQHNFELAESAKDRDLQKRILDFLKEDGDDSTGS